MGLEQFRIFGSFLARLVWLFLNGLRIGLGSMRRGAPVKGNRSAVGTTQVEFWRKKCLAHFFGAAPGTLTGC